MDANEELELLEKHKELVRIICHKHFLYSGVTDQDLYQEGLIALFRAIKTFDESKGIKFATYASTVIKNRLIDIVRKENSKEPARELREWETGGGSTTEGIFDLTEKKELIKRALEECTEIDRAIFKSHLLGQSYDEISKIFDITQKKVDNTIQKIKQRIRSSF